MAESSNVLWWRGEVRLSIDKAEQGKARPCIAKKWCCDVRFGTEKETCSNAM